MTTRYLVVGAGALGTWLAHNLQRGGFDVTLAERDAARVERLGSGPVEIVGHRLASPQPLACRPWEELKGGFDVAFLCVKPWEVEDALASLRQVVPNRPALVSCVGGIAALRLGESWPAEVLHAVVNCEMRLDDGGNVESAFQNFIWLGNLERTSTPLLSEVQEALSWAAPTLVTKVIEGMVWSRAAYSLEAGLAAVAEARPLEFYSDPAGRRAAARLVREFLVVAERFGIAPIGFDFFDPPLYRAASAGERATLDTWIRHAWQRHEQYRFGSPYDFPATAGLAFSLSPGRNGRDELLPLIAEARALAGTVGVATLAITALDTLAAGARRGRLPTPALVAALVAEPEATPMPA